MVGIFEAECEKEGCGFMAGFACANFQYVLDKDGNDIQIPHHGVSTFLENLQKNNFIKWLFRIEVKRYLYKHKICANCFATIKFRHDDVIENAKCPRCTSKDLRDLFDDFLCPRCNRKGVKSIIKYKGVGMF